MIRCMSRSRSRAAELARPPCKAAGAVWNRPPDENSSAELRCLYPWPWLAYRACDNVTVAVVVVGARAGEKIGECAVEELWEEVKLRLFPPLLPLLMLLDPLPAESRLLTLLLAELEDADADRLEATRANNAVRFCCSSTRREGTSIEDGESDDAACICSAA